VNTEKILENTHHPVTTKNRFEYEKNVDVKPNVKNYSRVQVKIVQKKMSNESYKNEITVPCDMNYIP